MEAVTAIATNEQVISKFTETGVMAILVLILVVSAVFLMNWMVKKQMNMQQKHNDAIIGVVTEKMQDISESIRKMVTYMGRGVLNGQETITVMRAIMNEHVFRKLSFFSQMLYKNHMDENVEEKKEMIRVEIERITGDEIRNLAKFNSRAGDLSDFLRGVDLDEFSEKCIRIMFSFGEAQNKLEHLKSMMMKYVNDLIRDVEEQIRKNTF